MEAAFFDLDKTIISRSSSLALSRPMYRAGMVTRGQLVKGAYAQLVYALVGADEKKMDRLKDGMLQLTKGWDRQEVERLVRDVLIEVIDPYVYQEALDLMALHHAEGRKLFIVSREHLFVLISFGDLLGVPVLPPYYSLRLLPFIVPEINNWKRRMMREKDLMDAIF